MSIDFRSEIQKFKPIDLSGIPDDTSQQTEDIRKSISLYNNALKKIKMKSEDIAVIELKKAVALNPEFSEALILLGLCYMLNNDYEKAEEMFRKAENTEDGKTLAAKYIGMLESDGQEKDAAPKKNNKKEKRKSSEDKTIILDKDRMPRNLSVYRLNRSSFRRSTQHSFSKYLATSLIVVCTLILILAVIGIIDSQRSNESVKGAKSAVSTTKQNTKALNQKRESTNNSNEYEKKVKKLDEAEKLMQANQYEAAGDILVELKNVDFKGQDKERYDKMVNEVLPKSSWNTFVKAEEYFNNGDYQGAVNSYKKMLSYGYDWDNVPIAMYHYGLSYMYLQDYNNALAVFNDLINRFPQSEFAEYAGYRINDINGGNAGYQEQQVIEEQPAQQQPQINTSEQQPQTNGQEQQQPKPQVQTPENGNRTEEKQTQPQQQEGTGTGTGEVPETDTQQEEDNQGDQSGQDVNQPTAETDVDKASTN